ncbi:unnamed protein product [Anisakis simplex]|uniref:Two-component sensor histidine kinase n=1 Tax=Anisakis simplex TaxID=6269 RepID=A0A0M3KBD4_ANISI|nr:unnamed protein product [Anisakis simplex]
MVPSESPQTTDNTRLTKQKCVRFLKIALPHLGLYLFLFFYLLGGAWTFSRIESSPDHLHQLEKLERVRNVYREIAIAATESCPVSSELDPDFRSQIFNSLSK